MMSYIREIGVVPERGSYIVEIDRATYGSMIRISATLSSVEAGDDGAEYEWEAFSGLMQAIADGRPSRLKVVHSYDVVLQELKAVE